jgi:hypothetical protein
MRVQDLDLGNTRRRDEICMTIIIDMYLCRENYSTKPSKSWKKIDLKGTLNQWDTHNTRVVLETM